MVVISASVCNKNGKILMARQFMPITRLKLEEYMANFPKLVESGKTIGLLSDGSFNSVCRKANDAHRDGKHKIRVFANGKIILGSHY